MIKVNCRKCGKVFAYNPDSNEFESFAASVGHPQYFLRVWTCDECKSVFAVTVDDKILPSGVFTQFFSEGTQLNTQLEENVKLSEIKKLKPLDRLVYWITERESIRLKKEAGEPRPWTDDPILDTYRFCNVRRADDKVSKWLLDNWYKPYFNHPNMLYAVALARFINKPESLEAITGLVFPVGKKPRFDSIKSVLRKRRDAGNVIFNGAYMVRGNDGIDKIECVVDHYVKPLKVQLATNSMEETWYEIYSCYGFGSFMAGQVVADLRHAVVGTWADKMTWAPIGPGSLRGMNRLHKRETTGTLNQKKFIAELRDLYLKLAHELPDAIFNRLELHDIQNTLCESDKYNRTLFGEGKPKQLYRSQS